jgi:hypothetical protein
MLANFLGVLPILTPPLCALASIMCPKSNPLIVFSFEIFCVHTNTLFAVDILSLVSLIDRPPENNPKRVGKRKIFLFMIA